MHLDITTDRIRNIAINELKTAGKNGKFSTEEAEAFLLIHGEQLEDELQKHIIAFVNEKLTY